MRIALVQMPQRDDEICIPLGILSQASFVKQYHQPIIIDFNLLLKNKKIRSSFIKDCAKTILKHRPNAIGLSVMCTTLPAALLVAEECKKIAPQIPIIFGGPEVTFEEEAVLKTFKQVDLIVRGEGEITLLELLNALEKRQPLSDIPGITYRENGGIIRTPDRPFIQDLDRLPYPDYSLLPHLEKYETGNIEAGRGCPFNCTFCSTCKMWKRHFRMKSSKRLIKEMLQQKKIFRERKDLHIPITHDNFLASKKAANKFLSQIKHKKIEWSCLSRLEPLGEALIAKLKKAGCSDIYIGQSVIH